MITTKMTKMIKAVLVTLILSTIVWVTLSLSMRLVLAQDVSTPAPAPVVDDAQKLKNENAMLRSQVASLQSSLKSAMRALNGCLSPDATAQQQQ